MRKVGSRELRKRLGRYMREVKGDGSLAVTERGEHIATISAKAKAGKEEAFDELLDQLETQALRR